MWAWREKVGSLSGRLLLLDRNATFTNLQLNARLCFFSIGIDAQSDDGDKKGADDEIQSVAVQSNSLLQ
jgi:hypothetical protein